jgi:hypothetical protein
MILLLEPADCGARAERILNQLQKNELNDLYELREITSFAGLDLPASLATRCQRNRAAVRPLSLKR